METRLKSPGLQQVDWDELSPQRIAQDEVSHSQVAVAKVSCPFPIKSAGRKFVLANLQDSINNLTGKIELMDPGMFPICLPADTQIVGLESSV